MTSVILVGSVGTRLWLLIEITSKHLLLAWTAGTLPISEDLSRGLPRLPSYSSLSESDIDAVAAALSEVLSA